MNNSHLSEVQRMSAIWPELSEGMRFNLLALAGLSLLRHGKLKHGFGALGSGARLRVGIFLRGTRDDLVLIGESLIGLFRPEEESLV